MVTVPWEVYKRSGKVQIVEEHYDAAHMFVQFLDTNSVNKSVRRVDLCFHSTRSLCGHGRLANLAGLCASSLSLSGGLSEMRRDGASVHDVQHGGLAVLRHHPALRRPERAARPLQRQLPGTKF